MQSNYELRMPVFQHELPPFHSCRMQPLEKPDMSSDKRIEGGRPADKKTEEEPTNENIQLTPEQPGDNAERVNSCERFVRKVFKNIFLNTRLLGTHFMP